MALPRKSFGNGLGSVFYRAVFNRPMAQFGCLHEATHQPS
jgi:hypothetical protein